MQRPVAHVPPSYHPNNQAHFSQNYASQPSGLSVQPSNTTSQTQKPSINNAGIKRKKKDAPTSNSQASVKKKPKQQ